MVKVQRKFIFEHRRYNNIPKQITRHLLTANWNQIKPYNLPKTLANKHDNQPQFNGYSVFVFCVGAVRLLRYLGSRCGRKSSAIFRKWSRFMAALCLPEYQQDLCSLWTVMRHRSLGNCSNRESHFGQRTLGKFCG